MKHQIGRMRPEVARAYVQKIQRIKGWFWPAAAYLFLLLDDLQKQHAVTGNIFEIGTYHGRSAVILAAMLDPRREHLGVCDLFGGTAECNGGDNGDRGGNGHSGGNGSHGFYDIFIRNFRRHCPQRALPRLFRRDSRTLTPSQTTANCRFFHIDGGHAAELVYRDLCTATRALTQDGILVLDDFYNFAWPGVAEGFFRFMHEHPGHFVPLAIGFNKGVLARPRAHGFYLRALSDRRRCWRAIPRGPLDMKKIEYCGAETLVFHVPSHRSPDPRRALLTMLYQHRPHFADAVSRLLGYHHTA